MASADVERLRVLLDASLPLWRIEGAIDMADASAVAVIHTSSGAHLRIDAATADELPIRWWVRWLSAEMEFKRARPCASVVGLLRTVRDAVGACPGMRAAVVPASDAGPGMDASGKPR